MFDREGKPQYSNQRLATKKQDWNKMCREVCGPSDYLEEHKKRKQKKRKQDTREEGEYMEVNMAGQ